MDAGFGYENRDGYVRVLDKPRCEGGKLVMRHRWFWELMVSKIPDGYEINHLCKNRRCFNPKHLECIPTSEHRSKDNSERYLKDFIGFKEYYLDNKNNLPSQKTMGKLFGRSQACISKWVNKVKEETYV